MKRAYFVFVLTLAVLLCACAPAVPAPVITPAATQPSTEPAAIPTTTPPVETQPAAAPNAFTVTDAPVYDAPSTEGQKLDTLPNRTDVTVAAQENGWSAISYDGKLGYVASAMLRKYEEGKNGYLVVIDAGHQRKGDLSRSPIGPGATATKFSVSGGTQGHFTGIPEYELNLAVAEMLQDILLERGYHVIMVRTTHDVNISNIQRAEVANSNYADVFIRIHANGSTNPNEQGAMTICMTKENPYNAHLFQKSYALSEAILAAIVENTGCVREGLWKTDTMSGINWSQVPVTIVEMGYMTNEEEDFLLATDEYRQQMAEGMANGIDNYIRTLAD